MTSFLVDALHLFYTLIQFLSNSTSTSTNNFYLICFSTGNQKRIHSNAIFCRRSAVILLITVSTIFLRYPFCSCLSSPVTHSYSQSLMQEISQMVTVIRNLFNLKRLSNNQRRIAWFCALRSHNSIR